MPGSEQGISILICSYNSALRLPETLRHIALQQVPAHIPWEVIVVNNASADNTASVATEIWKSLGVPDISLKVLQEDKPGKNYAFEKGIREAKFEYLLTCDDDNWLNDEYVATAFNIMAGDAEIGALGGLGIVEAEQPARLEPEELNQLTVNGPQTWAATDHWVYGAGSVYRRSILTGLISKGWQQITTGRKGSQLISGEDAEICFMIYLSGYKIIADDGLTFKHFVPLQRQDTAFIINMAFWLSYSYYLMYSYLVIIGDEKRSIGAVTRRLFIYHIKGLIKGVFRRVYQKLTARNSNSLSQKKSLMGHYGMVCAIITNRKKVALHHQRIRDLLKNRLSTGVEKSSITARHPAY